MISSDFRQRARDALCGNWFIAVIAGFLATLLGGISKSSTLDLNFSTETETAELEQLLAELGITEEMLTAIIAVIGAFAIFGLVYMLISIVVGSAVSVGYAQFNLDLVDGLPASVGTLFSRFGQWKNAFLARFLSGIFVALWSLLFVIPGIIAAYDYAMIPFVLAENPELSASEALAESKRLMRGNRWRLFCLEMSFIGWAFLSIFTLGIGSLFLVPYVQASQAAFYREIKREKSLTA
jgi:uncharacterized membrane protein